MKTTKKKCPKKKPLALMFWYGTENHELALCFKESKNKLIRAKAKAQNLPKTSEQAIDLLLTLSPEAIDIVRKWFQENAKFENLRDPETALEILKALPKNKIDSDEFKDEWRSILSLFSKESIPKNLIEFLQNAEVSIIKPPEILPSLHSSQPVEIRAENSGIFVTRKMVQACQQNFIVESEILTENILSILLDGAIAATKRDQIRCKKAKDALLNSGGVLGPDLQSLIFQLENNATRTGLRLKKALCSKYITSLDPQLHSAVAEIIKTLPSGQFFAKVIGMIVDQELIELSLAEACDTYPLAGEILAFPNTIPGHHHDGDWGVWRTDKVTTDKKNKYVIKTYEARIYDIISIPHPSTDPDAVREWLLSSYEYSSSIFPIFELSDQLLIRLPGDLKNPHLFKFDNPVDVYESLEGFEFSSGRRVVIGPLPLAQGKLDCAQPMTIIKRMLKFHDLSKQFPTFSRQQVDALSDLIKAEKDYPFKSSIVRAQKSLEVVSDTKEKLDKIIGEMLLLPKVSKQIEDEKEAILQKFAEELSGHDVQLKKLKDEKIKLEGDILGSKKVLKAQEQRLLSLTKEKFEKAQQDGVETLAQSALIKGIIGQGQRSEPQHYSELNNLEDQLASLELGNQLASVHELKLAIGRAAYATGFSSQLIATVISSLSACGVVGLVGARWDATAQIISTILSSGVRCSVSVSVDMFSLSDLLRSPALIRFGNNSIGLPLGDFLQAQSTLGRSSVVELIGANRAPPETYLPELIELLKGAVSNASVAWTGANGRIKTTIINSPVLILLGFVHGKSTFPMDAPLSTQISLVSVDAHWGDEPELDISLPIKASHISNEAWSELGSAQQDKASVSLFSTIDTKTRLSDALHKCGCNDPEILAKALLEAGRPNCILDKNEGGLSTISLVKQLLEVMHISGPNLFTPSRDF